MASLDTEAREYRDFTQAVLAIDWSERENFHSSAQVLSYAPGFPLPDVAWSNDHPGYKKMLGPVYRNLIGLDNSNYSMGTKAYARHQSLAFFQYIERILPNHRLVKAEILSHMPESVDRQSELNRMHIDRRNLHRHSKRCQMLLAGDDQSWLWVEDDHAAPHADKLLAFDNRKAHWGTNWGSSLKLTLVLDILDLDYWDKLSAQEQDTFFDPAPEDQDDVRFEAFKQQFKTRHNLA